ncbi:amino acid permease [Streptomyces sp. NPDC008121]|uniref:amino acid permease n=1 Tax=Streptomyces sp. NPDC008121 TaxID=3364809 RepID=UPI0036E2EF23
MTIPVKERTFSAPEAPSDADRSRHARRFGLPSATALVIGNIVGAGIFLLPAAIAPFGTVSLIGFAAVTLGVVALAAVFGRLARRNPSTGGPYVHARDAFGEFAGFISAWSYWIATWVSLAAAAAIAVGYAGALLPFSGAAPALGTALFMLWLPGLSNLAGTRYVRGVQSVTTVLKFVPLLLVALAGIFFFDAANLGPFQQVPGTAAGAVSASAAVLLFSYQGVEAASVSAGEVRDPQRNVGRATVAGTMLAALLYLLCIVAVFGTVPHEKLMSSQAPFSDSINAVFGGTWGGTAVACTALVSIAGAIAGFTLLSGQTAYAAAQDGLFPAVLAARRRGIPVTGVITAVILASLLVSYNYVTGTTRLFEVLVQATAFTSAVPYTLASAAQIYWVLSGRRAVAPWELARNLLCAAAAGGFSLWLIAGAGYQAVYQGALLVFAGVLIYAVRAAGKSHASGKDTAGRLQR